MKLSKEELQLIILLLQLPEKERSTSLKTGHFTNPQKEKCMSFFKETKNFLPDGIEILMKHCKGEILERAVDQLVHEFKWNFNFFDDFDMNEETHPFHNPKVAMVLIPKLIKYQKWPHSTYEKKLFILAIEERLRSESKSESGPNPLLVDAMKMFFSKGKEPDLTELLSDANECLTQAFFSYLEKKNIKLNSDSIKTLASIKNKNLVIQKYVLNNLSNVDSGTLYDCAIQNKNYAEKIFQNDDLRRKLLEIDNRKIPVTWSEMNLKYQRSLDSKVPDTGKIRRCDLEELLKAANLIEHDLHKSRGLHTTMLGLWHWKSPTPVAATSGVNSNFKVNLKYILSPKKQAIAEFLYYDLDLNTQGYLTAKGFDQVYTYVVTCFYKSNLGDHDRILNKLQEAMKDPRFDKIKTEILNIIFYWKEHAKFLSKEVATAKNPGEKIIKLYYERSLHETGNSSKEVKKLSTVVKEELNDNSSSTKVNFSSYSTNHPSIHAQEKKEISYENENYDLNFKVVLSGKDFQQCCAYVVTCFYNSNSRQEIYLKLQEAMEGSLYTHWEDKLLKILSYWKTHEEQYAEFLSDQVAAGNNPGEVILELYYKSFISLNPLPPPTNPFAENLTKYYYNITPKPSAPSILVAQSSMLFSPSAPPASIVGKSSSEEDSQEQLLLRLV